jgi:hypothetical protein
MAILPLLTVRPSLDIARFAQYTQQEQKNGTRNCRTMIRFDKLPDDILSKLPAAQEVLAADENVIFAYLFGSLARKNVHPLADVDIAVYLRDMNARAEYRLDLFSRLSDSLETAELDLVVLNAAPISLAGRILMHKLVLVDKRPGRRCAYESLTLREFYDYRIKEEAYFKVRFGID